MKLPSTTTNAKVLDIMMSRLGSRQSPKLRENLLFELNRKVDELETGATLPWFLEDTWAFDTTAEVTEYDLPEDFLREVEEGRLEIAYNGTLLLATGKVAYEDLDYASDNPAVAYALLGEQLKIAPVPDAVYNCTLPYLAATPEVEDSAAAVTNKWLINAFNWVTFETLEYVAAFHVQDDSMAARFRAEAMKTRDAVWRMHEARQHANRDYKIED